MPSRWTWSVTPEFESLRADAAITRAIEQGNGEWTGDHVSTSRNQIQRLIESAKITSDGKIIKPNLKLKSGSVLNIDFPAPEALDLVPENFPIDILYQDEHLLVLNKPPGLTVHPSSTQTKGTLVHALLHHVKDLSGIGGKLRPGIVHRIDKDTSGALVITKTDIAHQKLAETFSEHEIERVYWALVYGSPHEKKQKIESTIGRNPADRKKMAMNVKDGRHAISLVEKIEEYSQPKAKPFASWFAVKLETGRTHQVRVHLTGAGHSILADPVYGVPSDRATKWLALPRDVQDAVRAMPGQALHARVLGFHHPITGKELRFEAEPPPQFSNLLSALKKHL